MVSDMTTSRQALKTRQTGVVLVTGLIFMVILTIIVVVALRSATLEERMAANALNRQLALQAAEAALRDAEALIQTSGAPFDPFEPWRFTAGCTNGLCNKAAAGAAPRWKTVEWEAVGQPSATNIAGVKSQPRYIIEIANDPIKQGAICPKVLYRVTARGVGGVDNAIVFLQTMYRHLPASC